MLQLRALSFALAIALPIAGLSAESLRDIEGPEIVEISTADREALLAAPRKFMGQTPSVELTEVIHTGVVEKIKVEKSIERFTGADAREIGRDSIITYQGWIQYTPVLRTKTRSFRAMILCVSQGEEINWIHCQDESWVQFQTADMAHSVRLHGELDDEHVAQIIDRIDDAALVSKSTGQPVTSESISQVSISAYADATAVVSVKSSQDACQIDVTFLTQTTDAEGRAVFEISEIR